MSHGAEGQSIGMRQPHHYLIYVYKYVVINYNKNGEHCSKMIHSDMT